MKFYLNMIDAYWADMEECIEEGKRKKNQESNKEKEVNRELFEESFKISKKKLLKGMKRED